MSYLKSWHTLNCLINKRILSVFQKTLFNLKKKHLKDKKYDPLDNQEDLENKTSTLRPGLNRGGDKNRKKRGRDIISELSKIFSNIFE